MINNEHSNRFFKHISLFPDLISTHAKYNIGDFHLATNFLAALLICSVH